MSEVAAESSAIVQVSLELPQGIFSALRQDPVSFVGKMQQISQAKAAEIAGLSRSEFLTALARFGISPFQ